MAKPSRGYSFQPLVLSGGIMDTDRIKYHESIGMLADDYLETVYFQVYYQTSSDEDKRAFGAILDQYTKGMLQEPIPFGNAAFSLLAARDWIKNFNGNLMVWNVSGPERSRHPELTEHKCRFGAKVERGIKWAPCVYARTEHDVTILAGVQVLREIAYETLNPLAGTCKH